MRAFWAAMVVFGSGLAAAGATDIPPPMTAEAFRQAFNNASPTQIEIERVVTVTATAAEIEKQWAEIADKPDHPKRDELEYARTLAAQPLWEQITVTFGDGRWHYKRRSREGRPLDIAGDGTRMWMLSRSKDVEGADGQLTIIGADVPYPRGLNIPQLFDHHVLGTLARVGNWNVQPQFSRENNEISASDSVAFYLSDNVGSQIQIRRTQLQSDVRLMVAEGGVLKLRWKIAATTDQTPELWPFTSFARNSSLDRLDGRREAVRVTRIEAVSDAVLRSLTEVPVVGPHIRVLDFSTAASAAVATQEIGTTHEDFLTWTPERPVRVTPMGQAFSHTVDSPSPTGVAWSWWIAVFAVAAMLGGSIVLRRWTRS